MTSGEDVTDDVSGNARLASRPQTIAEDSFQDTAAQHIPSPNHEDQWHYRLYESIM